MDYRTVITPPTEQEDRERRRQAALRKALQLGNAPAGREPQPAAPVYRVGEGNAAGGQARAAKFALKRGEVLTTYDQLRERHPLALKKDIYAAVAKRCDVPDKTVRYWVQGRAREDETGVKD